MKPWSCIMLKVVEDHAFWAECVHVPAQHGQLRAPGEGQSCIASEASVLNSLAGGKDAQESVAEDSGERKRRAQANRDKRMAKKKRARDDREKPDNAKGRGKGKSKDQQGKAICFSWSSSSGPCADVPPGGECQSQVKRIHKCRICLSPGHQEKDCPNK